MRQRLLLCALAGAIFILLLPGHARAEPGTPEDKDAKAKRNAETAIASRCTEGFHGEIDKVEDRKQLEQNGLPLKEMMLEMLRNSEKPSEISGKLMDRHNEMLNVVLFGCTGFVMFILMISFFPCFYLLRFCGVSKYCCCASRSKKLASHPRCGCIFNLVVFVMMLAGCASLLYAMVRIERAHGDLQDGVDNLACTSAKMVHQTLDMMGQVVGKFEEVDKSLESDSVFMQGIGSTLNNTDQIPKAIATASGTLQLLVDMLENDANKDPKNENGGSLLHTCLSCEPMVEQLRVVIAALDEGVGAALSSTRSEVDAQLKGENLREMQAAFKEGTAPMINMKDMARNSLGILVEPGAYEEFNGMASAYGLKALVALILIAALLTFGGILALFFLMCGKEKRRATVRGMHQRVNKSTSARTFASCTWCCGWCYTLIAFFFGGLLMFICVPLSTGCLLLDDLNKELLIDVGSALDLHLDGDQGVMVIDLVEQCLNPADPSLNANLLDILFIRTENGTQTINEKIVGEVVGQIEGSFDELSAKMSDGETGSLANNSGVVQLVSMLQENPMDAMIVTDMAALQDQPEYLAASWAQSGRQPFSSARCDAFTPAAGVTLPNGLTEIPGIGNLTTSMVDYGGGVEWRPDPTLAVLLMTGTLPACFLEVGAGSTCPAGNEGDCEANDKILKLKIDMLKARTFRCDLWQDPEDAEKPCDIKDLAVQDAGAWCANEGGGMKRLERNCTLAEFTEYIQDFAIRIGVSMGRVDVVSSQASSEIAVGMKDLVDEHLIQPVMNVTEMVRCGFLGGTYREVVHGFCYQGVNGVSSVSQVYVGLGVAVVFLMFMMDALWFRTQWLEGNQELMRRPYTTKSGDKE